MASSYSFVSERIHALAGYLSPPTTYDGMEFYLPKFTVITQRVVHIRDRLWELWSPNSKVHAYYPGTRNETLILGTELPLNLRRSDGHLGRFDYTVSPQHFDFLRPWLGFIRKWEKDSRPENALFLSIWDPTRAKNFGRIRPSYVTVLDERISLLIQTSNGLSKIGETHPDLWTRRPFHLTGKPTQKLRLEMQMDDAVDLLAQVQRDVKELAAWNRMSITILKSFDIPEGAPIPPADDSLIGVWLNGCDELNGMWLLYHRVPCFVVHEGDSDKDRSRLEHSQLRCVTMHTHTHLARMEDHVRVHERRLQIDGQVLQQLDKDIGLGFYSTIKASTIATRYLSTPQGQGYNMSTKTYHDPRRNDSPVALTTSTIFSEKNGKIIPPPVFHELSTGSWTHWIQDTLDDGTECMRRRSSANHGLKGGNRYYDRRNKRMLYCDDPLTIPRHYDADPLVFGLPAPNLPYLDCLANDGNVETRTPSEWCYTTIHPGRNDKGRVYEFQAVEEPPPAALPDRDDTVSLGSEDEDDFPPAGNSVSRVEVAALPLQTGTVNREFSSSTVSDGEENSPSTSFGILRRDHLPLRSQTSRDFSPPRSQVRSHSRPQYRSPSRPDYRSRSRSRSFSRRRQPSRSRSPRRHRERTRSPYRRSSSPRTFGYSSSGSRLNRRDGPSSHVHRRRSRSRSASPARSLVRSTPRDNSTPAASFSVLVAPTRANNSVRPPTRPSLLSRMDVPPPAYTYSSTRTVAHNEIASQGLIPAHVLDMFPGPSSVPVPVLPQIGQGNQKRFLILWNVPVLYCWDHILAWIFDVLQFSYGACLKKIHRTNEDGYQLFWLAFATEHQATTFRGVVADRWTRNGHLVKCDFVSREEYSSIAGRETDKWENGKGYLGSLDTASPFPNDARGRLSHPKLAERLGIPLGDQRKPTRRGKKKGLTSNKRSTDGGAL